MERDAGSSRSNAGLIEIDKRVWTVAFADLALAGTSRLPSGVTVSVTRVDFARAPSGISRTTVEPSPISTLTAPPVLGARVAFAEKDPEGACSLSPPEDPLHPDHAIIIAARIMT